MRTKKIRCNIKMPPPMYQNVQTMLSHQRRLHPDSPITLTALLLSLIEIGYREKKRKDDYHKERTRHKRQRSSNQTTEEKEKKLTDLIMGEDNQAWKTTESSVQPTSCDV